MQFRDEAGQKVGVGSKFERHGEYHVLAYTGSNSVTLIDINTGYRWREPVTVECPEWLTRAEWIAVTGGDAVAAMFKLLPNRHIDLSDQP